MNATIVDDMATECEILRSLLKQYQTNQQQTIEIKEFHSGRELLADYIPGSYDVVFMDIFLNNENGVDCARILYADYQNCCACIHLKDCLVPVSGSFSELSDWLSTYPQFMSCFNGIVINLKEVRELGGDYLILKNGEQLPVSRRLQRQVQHQRLSLSAGSLRGEGI